ncbi:unnamed protein product, partial [Prorocentrum cordatum]
MTGRWPRPNPSRRSATRAGLRPARPNPSRRSAARASLRPARTALASAPPRSACPRRRTSCWTDLCLPRRWRRRLRAPG